MSINIQIVPATLVHVQELGGSMNAEDAAEAEALGLNGHRALWRSWRRSIYRNAILIDGKVGAMWGVSGTLMGLTGIPWFVTGPEVRKLSPYKFARIYRQEVTKLLEIYPKLVNQVDNRYIGAIRLLQLTGFKLADAEPLRETGKLFRLFEKGA